MFCRTLFYSNENFKDHSFPFFNFNGHSHSSPNLFLFSLRKVQNIFASKNARRFPLDFAANKPHYIFAFWTTKQKSPMLKFSRHVEIVINFVLSKFHHQKHRTTELWPKYICNHFMILSKRINFGLIFGGHICI